VLWLQEDIFFNRMVIYDPELYTTTPLSRVVDAAPAESRQAYLFRRAVDRWLETGDPQTISWLENRMNSWIETCEQLSPLLDSIPLLEEVKPHCTHLSMLAEVGLMALSGAYQPAADSAIVQLLNEARSAYGNHFKSGRPCSKAGCRKRGELNIFANKDIGGSS
jgi:hypothetical protein